MFYGPLLSFICFASCILAANTPQSSNPSTLQPAPGKLLYQVFPKDGIDLSTTAEFIRQTTGSEDISPWTDVNDKLMHWTVEASLANVAQLQGNSNIDHVDELQIPVVPANRMRSLDTPLIERQAESLVVKEYMVWARDGKSTEVNEQTEKYLQGLLGKANVEEPFFWDEALMFWVCTMSTTQRDEVVARPSVKAVHPNDKGGYGRHTSRHKPSILRPLAEESQIVKAKRASTYSTQKDAVVELVEVSQPKTVKNLKDLKNYVYESNSGVGTFVYHLEGGVAFKEQSQEFSNVVPDNEHLQTTRATKKKIFGDQPLKPWDDLTGDSHGTFSADKAVGQKFGVSKQAKLVVVQLLQINLDEIIEAFQLIFEDIKAKPARKKKSVVTMSMFLPKNIGLEGETILQNAIQKLFSLDVPVVVCAGNEAEENGRELVDTFPALLASSTFPLIVVGSTDHGGALSSFSQRGPHVTLHAPGRDITGLLIRGKTPVSDKFGTSYATPMVAGQIANLLSNPPSTLDTTVNGAVVQNVWNYLRSDYGSWERFPGIRVLWNGVTETDNPKSKSLPPAPAPVPAPVPTLAVEPSPVKQCHGLETKKWVERHGLADLIVKKFCPDVVSSGNDPNSGSVYRRYNQGTSEEIHLSLDIPPGTSRPSQDDCEKILLDITDGCDSDAKKNPANVKAGGSYTIKDRTYHIDPKTERKPIFGGIGDCDSTYKVLWNEYTVWGRAWESTNFGENLKKELGGCTILPKTWSFAYGLGKDDDREWTAKFRTGVFQKKCTGNAGKKASGWKDFSCGGSG